MKSPDYVNYASDDQGTCVILMIPIPRLALRYGWKYPFLAGGTSYRTLCIGRGRRLAGVHAHQCRDQNDYGKLVPVRRRLFRTCVITTGVSALWLLVLCNTRLVLTSHNYCVVLFTVPFTGNAVSFPRWMWGPIPFSMWVVSTLAALVLWTVLLVRRSRAQSMPTR